MPQPQFHGYFTTAAFTCTTVANGASLGTTVTNTGAALGDAVYGGWDAALANGAFVTGNVVAANTVHARIYNLSGAAIKPGAGVLTVISVPPAAIQ